MREVKRLVRKLDLLLWCPVNETTVRDEEDGMSPSSKCVRLSEVVAGGNGRDETNLKRRKSRNSSQYVLQQVIVVVVERCYPSLRRIEAG